MKKVLELDPDIMERSAKKAMPSNAPGVLFKSGTEANPGAQVRVFSNDNPELLKKTAQHLEKIGFKPTVISGTEERPT